MLNDIESIRFSINREKKVENIIFILQDCILILYGRIKPKNIKTELVLPVIKLQVSETTFIDLSDRIQHATFMERKKRS